MQEEVQLDGTVSEHGNKDEDRKITILSYVDYSFEQYLSFINRLVKTCFSDPSGQHPQRNEGSDIPQAAGKQYKKTQAFIQKTGSFVF